MSNSDFNLQYQNQSTESKIVASLERISQAFRVLLWQESKEFALSPIQVQVLIFLLHHSEEKRTVSYLAAEFNMTKATISDTVKALSQKGLVAKSNAPQDKRSYCLQLTAQGKKTAAATSLFTEEIRTPIDQMKPDDKEKLLLSLLGIISHLNQAGVITIQRMCFTCTYYQATDGRHFCTLLHQELPGSGLRLDCPEHKMKIA